MPETFDPYLKWLGIHEADRPPNHYRLLGLNLFESDPEVISNLADRQMAHVRTFATGRHSAVSQQLLNELASARVCLLNAKKKRAYDAELRARQPPQQVNAPGARGEHEVAPVEVAAGGAMDFASPAGASDLAGSLDSIGAHARTFPRRRQSSFPTMAVMLLGLTALAAGLSAYYLLVKPVGPRSSTAQSGGAGEKSVTPTTIGTGKLTGENPVAESKNSTANKDRPAVVRPRVRTKDKVGVENAEQSTNPFGERPEGQSGNPSSESPPVEAPPAPTTPETNNERLPVPSKEELAPARKLVGNLFDDEIKAARSAADKAVLADKLVGQAVATKDDPLARYYLLDLALELAVAGESWPVASRAIEQIASLHQVDEAALEAETFDELAKAASNTQSRNAIIRAALDAVDRAVADDDYDSARKIARSATNLAKKSDDKDLEARVKDTSDWVALCDKEFKANQASFDKLKLDPHDRDALSAVGRFECLVTGDWKSGLSRLAQGSDAPLAELAVADLANPSGNNERNQMAERWWDTALKLKGINKSQAFGRAEHWYRLALPQLEGISKTKTEKRLKEIAKYSPRTLTVTGRSAARQMTARIYACGDDEFSMAVNGRPIMEGPRGQLRELDYQFFPGDIVTVRAINAQGRRSFCCAIKFTKLNKVLLTTPGQWWQEYLPESFDNWSQITGIRGHRPSSPGDQDFVQAVRKASGTTVGPIWGHQDVCFLVLEIPKPADLP